MGDDVFLKQAFPGFELQIEELRAADTVFDEICIDYIEMCRELHISRGAAGNLDERYLTNIKECVAALQTEILLYLQSPKPLH